MSGGKGLYITCLRFFTIFYFERNNGNLIRLLWSYYKISEIMSRENILADFGFCRNLKSDQKLSEPNLFFFFFTPQHLKLYSRAKECM